MDNTNPPADQRNLSLMKFIRELSHFQDLEKFLSSLVEFICQHVPCKQCLVLLFEAETDTLKIIACPPQYKEAVKNLRLPLEQSLAGKVYYSGKPIIINPNHTKTEWFDMAINREIEKATGSPTENLAIVPMVFRGETVGVLEARNRVGADGFDSDSLDFLETLSGLAAVAVLSYVLFDEVEFAHTQVKTLEQLKSNFIAITSHELRTPIGLILGHATFLEELISDPELKYQMGVILKNTSRLKEIVENLTRVNEYDSGLSRLKHKPISIHKLIQKEVPNFRQTARQKNIQISVRLPESDLVVDADEDKIAVVLNNLIHNALLFTDPGGRILVTAERLPGYVQVSVIDSGIGIPPDELHKVFDRFFQVQSHLTRKHGGIGIGLSVAKAMVELHKGQIWVESKEGQGSKFTFLLPTQASTMERLKSIRKEGSV